VATKRLYHDEAYRRRFASKVPGSKEEAGRCWLLLERTLFYPTSGGQPHDLGTLGGMKVLDVKNEGDEVWHLIEGPAPKEGEVVEGVIDWPRRYRHMQRHSAQHLLSQAFLRTGTAFTTQAVSLGGPVCTVDLAGEPDEGDLEAAERIANEAAYANYPVEAFEVSAEEIHRYPLRRPPKVSGSIRLVRMGDWEISACGGTHVRSTAEAAPIKLLRLERVRGGLARVHFRSGLEALEDYATKHRIAYGLATALSSAVEDVPERILALQRELQETRRQLAAWQERFTEALAARLLEAAEPGSSGRVVTHILEEDEMELLKPLAQALVEEPEVIALLGGTQNHRAQLLFARSQTATADMKALLGEALPLIEGRGGGRVDFAQGAGARLDGLSEALAHARKRLM
jgi:alanyl-tRNA synthetase